MTLYLINAQSTVLLEDVVWVEANTVEGNFIILPGHAPLICTLLQDKPFIIMQKNERTEIMHVQKSAFLEIVRDVITVIM